MERRVVEIAWLPRSAEQWLTFTASRQEAAQLWADLVERHRRIRRWRFKWPSEARWNEWAKGRYPLLLAQSVQQIIGEFLEAIQSAADLRKNGHPEARYPWRTARYRDVVYTNQAAVIRNGQVILPHGKPLGAARKLRIKLPTGLQLPGRLMEARLMYGRLLLVCEAAVSFGPARQALKPVAADLGVNTLIAATDGEKTLLISGREAKATVQWRNKMLASIQAAQSKLKKRSRRWMKLQRRKHKMLDTARRRINDLIHKATRMVANEFPASPIIVGEPFNDAAQKMGRVQAQQVSSACNAKIIKLLDYKMAGAVVVPEPYSSQTCPVCGCRNKCRRMYQCQQCGFRAPRDVVGSSNILSIGTQGTMRPDPAFRLPRVSWKHPSKYPGKGQNSTSSQVVPAEPRQVARSW